MIKSMTGYGGGKAQRDGLELSAEIKSVNNRYLDCSVRLPRNFLFAEEAVKSAVSSSISRGKVDVFITATAGGEASVDVRVNEALAAGYVGAIEALAERFSIPGDLSAAALSRYPDVVSAERRETDKDIFGAALADAMTLALTEFEAMREREGKKLEEDIKSRISAIEALVKTVEEKNPETVSQYRQKLFDKMTEVLKGATVDEQRILTEAAIFADKTAVDEETVRLKSHISQLREMLQEGSPIGRKMDFLVQEFNREANTIGSKCNDSEITKTVIELKSEIEKIREQVQNIE